MEHRNFEEILTYFVCNSHVAVMNIIPMDFGEKIEETKRNPTHVRPAKYLIQTVNYLMNVVKISTKPFERKF